MKAKTVFLLLTLFLLLFSGCVQREEKKPEGAEDSNKMKITSPAFAEKAVIPKKYTCNGENINPPLKIEDIPKGTKTLVLIVDDPDAPIGIWDHWIVWNIPPVSEIAENSVPAGAVQGVNSGKENKYYGPCPPYGTHRYRFIVYALDTAIKIPETSRRRELEAAMSGRVLAEATLTGVVSS